jgi:hypothetical protein
MDSNTPPVSSPPERNLFRPAAVAHHRRRLAGDIVISEPRWLLLAWAGFFGLLLVGVALAVAWPMARVTKVEGTLTLDAAEAACTGVRRMPFEPRQPMPAALEGRPASLELPRAGGALQGPLVGAFTCAPQDTAAPGACKLRLELPCDAAAHLPTGTWPAQARVELPPVTFARLVVGRFVKGSGDANH